MAAIDPHTVPPFPVYTLLLNEHTQRIELDGMPLEPSGGQDYKQAGIQAIIRKASVQNLDAVRVNVHNHEGDRWSMVVTQDGNVYDTTPAEEEEAQPTNYRSYMIGDRKSVVKGKREYVDGGKRD